MAFAYDRSWQFLRDYTFNEATSLAWTNHQLWNLCSALVGGTVGGFTQGRWTLYASSDGVTAGIDATDRLNLAGAFTSGNWVHAVAGVAHSWVVLQSPTMNGYTFYLTIDCNSGTVQSNTFVMSKAAPTGGSTTARPTATDEWADPTVTWNGANTGAGRFNIAMSTTGDFYCFTQVGTSSTSWGFVTVVAPVGCHADDKYPIFNKLWREPTLDGFTQGPSGTGCRTGYGDIGQQGLIHRTTGTTVNAANAVTDNMTGNKVGYPAWLAVGDATRGWHARGRLPDAIVLATNGLNPTNGGTVDDGAGTIRYQQVCDFLLPFDAASTWA